MRLTSLSDAVHEVSNWIGVVDVVAVFIECVEYLQPQTAQIKHEPCPDLNLATLDGHLSAAEHDALDHLADITVDFRNATDHFLSGEETLFCGSDRCYTK